jgi:hypothetical protein
MLFADSESADDYLKDNPRSNEKNRFEVRFNEEKVRERRLFKADISLMLLSFSFEQYDWPPPSVRDSPRVCVSLGIV